MDLFNLGTVNGVTAVLTIDAWSALSETLRRMHLEESELRKLLSEKRTLDLTNIHPFLIERITRGTMTFVEAPVWRESDLARTLHTGTTTELEELGRTHKIEIIPDFPFRVPFSTGHTPTDVEELVLGFGPRPMLLAELSSAS